MTEPVFQSESFGVLTQMLASESDAYVLEAEILSLGHLRNVAAVPYILPYTHHPSESVRFAVAFSVGCYPNEPTSITILQRLMEDCDQDVRDWAIFGLGVQGDADSDEIRRKLLKCLEDSFLDARIEAAAALGKRRDERLAGPLIKMLQTDGALVGLTEAAAALLGMGDDPPEWGRDDYLAALKERFPDATDRDRAIP